MAVFHLLYRSLTTGVVPSAANMPNGRLALNLADERIFFKNASGSVVEPQPRSHTHPVSEVVNLQTSLDAKVNTTTTITAGVGLSGGGSLAANRTISMGAPSTITGSTTNSATGTTHTHAITLTAANVGAIATTAAGAPNGVATLNSGGVIPELQIPLTYANVNTVSGTSLALGFSAGTNVIAGNYNRTTAATPVTLTITTGAAIFPQEFHVRQAGTGIVTFVADGGVTINPPFGGNLETGGEGATVTLKYLGSDTYDLIGQTGAA